jgi:hypothetical protein
MEYKIKKNPSRGVMAQHGLVKVTIVGYYPVSDQELDAYNIEEFDPVKMAAIDQEEFARRSDLGDVVSWFLDERPTSVTFEAVDFADVDENC